MNFKLIISLLTILLMSHVLFAQRMMEIGIKSAIELGVANSKALKLSQTEIQQAVARLEIVKDQILPTATAGLMYTHNEILSGEFNWGKNFSAYHLPKRTDAIFGTVLLKEVLYGGGKLRYGKESTRLLIEVARLDADMDLEEVTYAIINTYYSLYKMVQSLKVVDQNLESLKSQVSQAERFFDQGLVTKNDVLRFKLRQANIVLEQLDMESNRRIIHYNLAILLGLPEDIQIKVSDPGQELIQPVTLNEYIALAIANRKELKQLAVQNTVAGLKIKSIKANAFPSLALNANLYYFDPSASLIPMMNRYIVPLALGASLSWNIASIYTNRNKVSKAGIEQKTIAIQKDLESDKIKSDVNRHYQNYLTAVNNIQVLETSIVQAIENDRLLASKYKNNVASVTDRIDAESVLYQAKISLEIAKANAGLAYYALLKSTGTITQPTK
ncbi:MAG: TolC family protein [Acinetobacter sp.]|nr:MAG: TolC family protein [Acinetobacter sp.]